MSCRWRSMASMFTSFACIGPAASKVSPRVAARGSVVAAKQLRCECVERAAGLHDVGIRNALHAEARRHGFDTRVKLRKLIRTELHKMRSGISVSHLATCCFCSIAPV